MTTAPQDLFYTINQQLSIIMSFDVTGEALHIVGLMLADVFTHYQDEKRAFMSQIDMDGENFLFGPEREEKPDSYFCAIINNNQHCQDNMEDISETMCEKLAEWEETQNPKAAAAAQHGGSGNGNQNGGGGGGGEEESLSASLEEAFDDVGIGFVTVATEAVDILVMMILYTLRKPLDMLFTEDWLKGSGAIQEVTATLRDFFDDYKEWISRDAYFGMIVKNCMTETGKEYLRRFIATKPEPGEEMFAQLTSDRKALTSFFEEYTYLVPSKTIKQEMSIIEVISEVVTAEEGFINVHFEKISTRFGKVCGVGATERAFFCRLDLSASTVNCHYFPLKFECLFC